MPLDDDDIREIGQTLNLIEAHLGNIADALRRANLTREERDQEDREREQQRRETAKYFAQIERRKNEGELT